MRSAIRSDLMNKWSSFLPKFLQSHDIFQHKATRVCTFSRPYFIGPGSVRHHNVPVSAIPCLHQRRVLKEVEENAAAVAAKLQNALSEKDATKSSDNTIEDPAIVMARLQAPGTKVQVDFTSQKIWEMLAVCFFFHFFHFTQN